MNFFNTYGTGFAAGRDFSRMSERMIRCLRRQRSGCKSLGWKSNDEVIGKDFQ